MEVSPWPFLAVGLLVGGVAAFFIICTQVLKKRISNRALELFHKGATPAQACEQLVAEGTDAAMCAQIVPRAAPIQLLARQASASDTDLAAVYQQIQHERLTGLAGFAAHLHQQRHLADGVTTNQARDILWTYNSPELYELLVLHRRWNLNRYRTHIATAVTATLLP